MIQRSALFLWLIGISALAQAQPTLLPSIGIGALPADSDPICTLPVQTPPITSCGRPEGESAAGFTLSGKINRKDWDLNWNAALETGGVLVSDEVHIIAEVQFVKQA